MIDNIDKKGKLKVFKVKDMISTLNFNDENHKEFKRCICY